jgi:hypothetical protein
MMTIRTMLTSTAYPLAEPPERAGSLGSVPPPVTDLPLLARGKVREMYDLGDRIVMVASDRISTYDVVHPTPIPDTLPVAW